MIFKPQKPSMALKSSLDDIGQELRKKLCL